VWTGLTFDDGSCAGCDFENAGKEPSTADRCSGFGEWWLGNGVELAWSVQVKRMNDGMTYSENVALLVCFLGIEESVYEQELENGRYPLVTFGYRVVSAQRKKLVKSPMSTILNCRNVGTEGQLFVSAVYRYTYPFFSSAPSTTPCK